MDTFDTRGPADPLPLGVPENWETTRRHTVPTLLLIGANALIALGMAWLFFSQGLIVGVLPLVSAIALVWWMLPRRPPLHDVLLRRPDAQESGLGISFVKQRWRIPLAAWGLVAFLVGTALLLPLVVVTGVSDPDRRQPWESALIATFGLLAIVALPGAVRRARQVWSEPDLGDVVLTARGVRVGDHEPLIPWDAIRSVEPTIDLVPRGKTNARVPRIWLHHDSGDAAIDVNTFRQHPVAMLNILEFYRAHPRERVELGMENSVLRCRRITAAINPQALR